MNVMRSLWVLAVLPLFLVSCAGSLPVGNEPTPSVAATVGGQGDGSDIASGAAPGVASEPARPILEILDPRAGQTIRLPAEIRYRVVGIDLPSGARLRIIVENLPTFDIPVSAESGTVVLADDKAAFLPGFRDVTFELITAEGTRLAPPVTVDDLTIEGRRGG